MTRTPNDSVLLTPGPLTTAHETKLAMLHDWGSRDEAFIGINQRVRDRLLSIVNAKKTYACVPLQGSGTFIVEATLCTLIPKNAKTLVLINGAYGKRISKILDYSGRKYTKIISQEDNPINPREVEKKLKSDKKLKYVVIVHCETTSGILNPIQIISKIIKKYQRSLIIDAMSSFGAIPIDCKKVPFDAVIASSNKCLEGVPGMGFAIIRKTALENCEGHSHSLSLDIFAQWKAMELSGQWRFTPPTHVIAAFDQALTLFEAEGGVINRNSRYKENAKLLIEGMTALGFETILKPDHQAPIIITFKMPKNPNFKFQQFYNGLKTRGFIIYPGKLTEIDSFRMGCIGHLGPKEMLSTISAVHEVLSDMNIDYIA